MEEIEIKGLVDVESKGIYHSASENAKMVMDSFLAEFENYEIVYM